MAAIEAILFSSTISSLFHNWLLYKIWLTWLMLIPTLSTVNIYSTIYYNIPLHVTMSYFIMQLGFYLNKYSSMLNITYNKQTQGKYITMYTCHMLVMYTHYMGSKPPNHRTVTQEHNMTFINFT